MNRWCRTLILVALLAGCGGPVIEKIPSQQQAPMADDVKQDAHSDDVQAQGVDLRMFVTDPTTGAARNPTFWVHADKFSLSNEDIWSLTNAKAVIYSHSEGEEEQIYLEAGTGRFQQETQMAYLKEGVIAHAGQMRIELNDIEWVNEQRVARSENPVSLETPNANISAATLQLYPDKKQLIMTGVQGAFQFDKE